MRVASDEKRAEEVLYQGIPVVIEYRKGDIREGVNADGESWSREMLCPYGAIPNTESAGDEEEVDVYLGPSFDAPNAYVVEQLDDEGNFDEHKLMLGFHSAEEARQMYLAHYPEGWESHIGDFWEVPVEELKTSVDEHTLPQAKTARFLTIEDCYRAYGDKYFPGGVETEEHKELRKQHPDLKDHFDLDEAMREYRKRHT
jgi:hypothetical protein